ncbi:MAG: TfoX/Sxy family protein [Burkholderiales bacterium]|jgi:DNA transformation protein
MTRPIAPFTQHCLELLAPLGRPRAKAMFGGVGLYVDDLFVALIADDTLFLKVSPAHEPAFVAAGCEAFTFTTKDGRSMSMAYRTAPEEALDSAEAMRPWARRAMEAALMAANAKKRTQRKP